jgi:GNAT superfamily N-acetyltransferase
MILEIRALAPDDDRSRFQSDDEALDLFFHRYAGQNQFRYHIGVTYVAVTKHRIVGFATVAPATLDADALPTSRRMPPYPIPVLRIARLATDSGARGTGVGNALMRFCIELAEKLRDDVGCVGILVDAKPGAAGFYERLGFAPVRVLEGAARTTPAATAMFLSLASVPRSA